MNATDARKLTDAIKDLTRQLRSGGGTPGGSPGGSPSPSPQSPASENDSDPVSRQQAELDAVNATLSAYQAVASWKEKNDAERLARLAELKQMEADSVEMTREQKAELEALIPFQLGYTEAIEEAVGFAEQFNKEREKEERQLRKTIREQEHLTELERERHYLLEDTQDVIKDTFKSIVNTSRLKPDPKRGIAGFLRAVTFDAEAREEALDAFRNQIASFKSLLTPVNLLAAGMEGLGVAIGSAVTLGFGLLLRAVQAVIEFVVAMAFKFDDLGKEIAKTTGHGREYAVEMINAGNATTGLTKDAGELIPNMLALSNTLAGVSGMTRQTAYDFSVLATAAQKMGVDAETTGQFIKDAMVGGKMSTEETTEAFLSLNEASKLMNTNFSELASAFSSNRATFSAYGQNMQKVFLRSSSVAKQMGVELGTVLGMSDKFKSFEDSAAFVSEFNHMVGASLDPLEMMRLRAEEGPEAVALALKESMAMSGKSFDEMSFAMREGIADSLGVPMNELRNMMSSDVDMTLIDEVENAAQPMDTFIDKANAAMSIMERLQAIATTAAEKIGAAFGLDKLAGDTNLMTAALDKLQEFVEEDLTSFIKEDLVPFVQDTLMPFLKNDLKPILSAIGDGIMKLLSYLTSEATTGSTVSAMEAAGIKVSEASKDDSTGTTDSADRIKSVIGDILTSSLSEDRKNALLKNAMKNEKLLSESDFNFMTDEAFVEKTFRNAIGTFAGEVFGGAFGEKTTKTGYKYSGRQNTAGAERVKNLFGETPAAKKQNFGNMGMLEDGLMYLHKGEQIIPADFYGTAGAPYSQPGNTQQSSDTNVNVVIRVNDRKLREIFSTTVEKVLVGDTP